ncbi:MAG: hypothetical protein HRU11_02830 [Parvularculaceae bacterium]|nr:hypothetical protein [Parvularculaceae bacterium]
MTDITTYQTGLSSPPSRGMAVSPDDGADLAFAIRGLMVSTAGDVALVTTRGDTITMPALQPGVQYAVLSTRVLATGTTATGLVGLA